MYSATVVLDRRISDAEQLDVLRGEGYVVRVADTLHEIFRYGDPGSSAEHPATRRPGTPAVGPGSSSASRSSQSSFFDAPTAADSRHRDPLRTRPFSPQDDESSSASQAMRAGSPHEMPTALIRKIAQRASTIPVIFVLSREMYHAAWDDDGIRLRYLSRKHFGVIVVHPQGEPPLSGRMANGVLDELYQPYPAAAIRRSIYSATRLIRLELEKVELRRELGRRAKLNRELLDTGAALSAVRDLDSLLDRILAGARRFTDADAGSIYLAKISGNKTGDLTVSTDGSDADLLRFSAAQNDSVTVPFQSFSMPLNSNSIAGCCAVTKRPVIIEDAYNLPDGTPFHFDRSFDTGVGYRTKSILCVPLIDHQDMVIGVLQLINRKPNPNRKLQGDGFDPDRDIIPFDRECEQIVSAFASQAAVAINTTILLSNIEELIDGLVRASVVAIESRDPATSGHTERVTAYTLALAETVSATTTGPYADVRFSAQQLRELRYAGLLHDFGKVSVDEAVLTKAKKLYPGGLEIIRQRFETIKRDVEVRHLRSALERLYEDGAEPDEVATLMRAVRKAILRDWSALDLHLAAVEEANEPTVLPQEVAGDLDTLSALTWRVTDGTQQPFLTDAERALLTIPKGTLTPDERLAIERHVLNSWDFLRKIPWTRDLRKLPIIAATHHERLDGTGYPFGLTGEAIPLGGKIMAVADIFDALTASDRPYKKSVPVEKALEILRDEAARNRIDAELVRLFEEEEVYQAVLGAQEVESGESHSGTGRYATGSYRSADPLPDNSALRHGETVQLTRDPAAGDTNGTKQPTRPLPPRPIRQKPGDPSTFRRPQRTHRSQ